MEEEWSRFREAVLEVRERVCGTRRIREGMRKKGCEWWSEEIRKAVERKKNVYWYGRRQEVRKI